MTCAVLHNIAKLLNDQYQYDLEDRDEAEEDHVIDEKDYLVGQQENRATKIRGEQKREEMLGFI